MNLKLTQNTTLHGQDGTSSESKVVDADNFLTLADLDSTVKPKVILDENNRLDPLGDYSKQAGGCRPLDDSIPHTWYTLSASGMKGDKGLYLTDTTRTLEECKELCT